MASEVRVNQIQNRSGLGTITVADSGVVISGITTISDLRTSGGALTVGTGASISSPSTNVLTLGTNNTESVRINSTGVGIGTNNPTTTLDVGGEITIRRTAAGNEGGQINFARASDNAVAWNIDAYGSTSTPSLRFIDATAGASRVEIDGSGNLKLPTAGTKVLNSSGNPILQQTGSVLQVAWKNLGSGSFTATSTSSTYRATGFTNTITPTATSSKILHIVTIGVQFICDGNLTIARGGVVTSPSLMDSYRDVSTTAYINDLPAFTFTWLDSPSTTSAINYELYCRATGCGGLMFVGSSSDFDSSWTLMEIAG